MGVDIISLVEQRKKSREFRKRKRKFYLRISFIFLIIISILFIKIFLKVEVENYNIKYNKEAIDEVLFIDNLNNIDSIRKNNQYKYFIQSDLNNKKSFKKYSEHLKENNIENYFIKEGKVLKLIIVKGFEDINSAESYANNLKKEGLLNTYSVRVR